MTIMIALSNTTTTSFGTYSHSTGRLTVLAVAGRLLSGLLLKVWFVTLRMRDGDLVNIFPSLEV